jgi:8-amino-7-oxononanoate synthase
VDDFETTLREDLREIETAGLLRQLRRVDAVEGTRLRLEGRWLTHFASNDYLGFAGHPALAEAAAKAASEFGAGSGASRLMCGSLGVHHTLEEALAAWKNCEAALTFSSGYGAAVGTIPALLRKDDVVIVDKLVHACCIDAARLSDATLRVYRHNDLGDLERILVWVGNAHAGAVRPPRVLIVTESVFSMDGDQAPLAELVELKDRYGAWLMLDEAHATGLFGQRHCGLAEALGVADRVEVQMGTLSKALGASGGFIAGRRALIDLLVNSARSFIFSTAPVPAAAAAAKAAVDLLQGSDGDVSVRKLWNNIERIGRSLSLSDGNPIRPESAIVPWIVGSEAAATTAASRLRDHGLFIPAVRYPTVARGKARLRFTVTAMHTASDFLNLEAALKTVDIGSPIPHA